MTKYQIICYDEYDIIIIAFAEIIVLYVYIPFSYCVCLTVT